MGLQRRCTYLKGLVKNPLVLSAALPGPGTA